MDPDLSALDTFLDETGERGYLIDADGTNSDQRYLTGFAAPDPFVTLYDGAVHLLVSGLEYGRATRQSRADTVARLSEYDYREKLDTYGEPEAGVRVLAEFLSERDVDSVATPQRFPLGTADGLREHDVRVSAESRGVVTDIRARKTAEELEYIRTTQRANERAMRVAEQLIAESRPDDGELVLSGEPLTSERVRTEIEMELLRHGCGLDETIVACGADAADPHDRGSGPLVAGEPIIVDIFPKDKETGYHADMTRTFSRGEPSDTVRKWFDLTDDARLTALETVEPGVTGAAVHDAVCDVYEDAGLPTLRSDESTETGFIHTTGHGVGLDVHEQPRVGPSGGELKPGHVITIEPGLYDPQVGGVRIEDLVVVTDDGAENLTEYPVDLVAA